MYNINIYIYNYINMTIWRPHLTFSNLYALLCLVFGKEVVFGSNSSSGRNSSSGGKSSSGNSSSGSIYI